MIAFVDQTQPRKGEQIIYLFDALSKWNDRMSQAASCERRRLLAELLSHTPDDSIYLPRKPIPASSV